MAVDGRERSRSRSRSPAPPPGRDLARIKEVTLSGFLDAALNVHLSLDFNIKVSRIPIYSSSDKHVFMYGQPHQYRWAISLRYDPASNDDVLELIQQGEELGLAYQESKDEVWW